MLLITRREGGSFSCSRRTSRRRSRGAGWIAARAEPTVRQKALYDQMSRLSGTAFDRAFVFVREMIAEHKMNIPSFKMRQRRRTIR
jgi:hypothetical protein